jgi:arsenite-transporting ATPase
VIINEVIPREVLQGNWFLERRRATQDKYLALIEEKFKDLIRAEVPLFESDIYGVDNLRKVGRELYE